MSSLGEDAGRLTLALAALKSHGTSPSLRADAAHAVVQLAPSLDMAQGMAAS
jgi:hypothetical protein